MTRRPGPHVSARGPLHAVVIGGSLAGQCAALALSRDGWRVTVLERSSAEPPEGTGIGIDRKLLSSVVGADAGALPVINAGFPATAWGLLRTALIRELQQRSSVSIRTGHRVVDISTGGNQQDMVVRTTECDVHADLIVGADGYGSVARRVVAPERPDAVYAGYLLWRGLIKEQEVPGGFTARDITLAEHPTPQARLVTFGVPGGDGDTRPGQRRGSFTWFDSSRTPLLRRLGHLKGTVVTGTLTGHEITGNLITELRHLARQWPSPWRQAINRSLLRREFIGTPVTEYLPAQLVRGSVVLVGDAAHVVSPITGAGFHNGLLDIAELASSLRSAAPGEVQHALLHYQRQRLQPARQLVAQSQQWSRAYIASH